MTDPTAAPARQAAGNAATLPPAFAAVLALDGTVLQIDRATLDMQFIEASRIVGRALWDCACWGEGDELRARLRRAIGQAAGGEPQRRAVRLRLPGQSTLDAEFHVIPVHDRSGRISSLVALATDMSARSAAEAALRASEERLVRAQRAGRVGVYDWDLASNEVSWSPETLRLFGAAPGDGRLSYQDWRSVVHPDDIGPLESGLMQWLSSASEESAWAGVYRIRRFSDGAERWIEARGQVTCGPDGRPVRMLGTNIDITEQRAREEELRASEARFRSLSEGMPHAVWITDDKGSTVYQNHVWHAYAGSTPGSVSGWRWLDYVHADDRATMTERWQAALAAEGRVPYDVEARIRATDGSYRWFRLTGSPIRDSQGRVTNWVGLCTDVDEQRRLVADLRRADAQKDEFIATLAHELRNPLAPIRSAVEILKLVPLPAPEAAQARDIVDHQSQIMVRLIDDLLDVSRITLGKLKLRRQRIELAAAIQRALETARPNIAAAGHRLTVTLPPGRLQVDADEVRLAQVFANLLNNAAKFTPAGGSISLGAEARDGGVEVWVRDSGVGIAAEHLPYVFDKFSQLGDPLGRSHGGLGIGLTLVNGLTRMHGGRVAAASAGPGQGSEFRVWLPLAADPDHTKRRAAPAAAPTAAAGTAQRRLLVVDDDSAVADAEALLLRLMGHEVLVARSGDEALAVAESFVPDTVLLDIGMPGINGYEVCRRLRAQAGGRRLQIIAVTGWGQDRDRQRAADAGFDAHLVKPLDHNALVTLLGG